MVKHLGLKAYGKINLGLDVLRRREDGYHEVRMIMQTVGLYDRIDLVSQEQPGIRVETNLYYLFGVNKMFGLGLTLRQLMERGVKIGADVPYCIMRGTALSEGIGEILTPLPPMPQCQVLIAKPGISVSTKFVYENLHANDLKPEQHPDIDSMARAIGEGDIYKTASYLGNVLETVTVPAYPVIAQIKDMMMDMGAIGSLMSGSGPTVFGLFTNPRAAAAAYEKMRYGEGVKVARQVYLTNFYNRKE